MTTENPAVPETFDPYYLWLGIPPHERPLDYYILLGIRQLERNADVIQQAADRQMAHLRTFQNGAHVKESQRLLNEMAKARTCLLNPEHKRSYDNKLRKRINESRQKHQQLEAEPATKAEREVADGLLKSEVNAVAVSGDTGKFPLLLADTRPQMPVAPPRKSTAKPTEGAEPDTAAKPNKSAWSHKQQGIAVGVAAGFVLVLFATLLAWVGGGRGTINQGLVASKDPAQEQVPARPRQANENGPEKVASVPITPSDPVSQPPSQPLFRTDDPVDSALPTETSNELKAEPDEPFVAVAPAAAQEAPMALPSGFTEDAGESVARTEPTAGGDPFAEPPGGGDKPASNVTNGTQPPKQEGDKQQANSPTENRNESPKSAKPAVPSLQVQRDVAAVAEETFRKDLMDARTPEQRAVLAKRFLETAQGYQPGDPARYVMFNKAAELAAEVGAGDLILQAVDGIAAEYDIDAMSKTAELLERSGKSRFASASYDSLLRAMLSTVDLAVAADRMEIARDLITAARAVAVKTKGRALLGQVNELNAQVRDQASRFAEVRRAEQAIDDGRGDAKGHFVVGSYRCFVKGEWNLGLPHLAKCSDKDLADLAKLSQSPPTEPARVIEIGDRWWDRGSEARGRERQQQLIWACRFYKQALPNVHGLVKTKIEKRILEVDKTVKK